MPALERGWLEELTVVGPDTDPHSDRCRDGAFNGHNTSPCNADDLPSCKGDKSHPNVDLGMLTSEPSDEHELCSCEVEMVDGNPNPTIRNYDIVCAVL